MSIRQEKKQKTLKDVSDASGVSLVTVSRALRTPETVQDKTRQKILQVIDDIGYVPNLTARSLQASRSNIVGIVVPMLSDLFANLVQGAATVLQENAMQMLLGVSERKVELEETAIETFIGRQADAIVVTGFTHSVSSVKKLKSFPGPVVETWGLKDDPIDLVVGYNNYLGAAEMTRYLVGKGYQKIALVGGEFQNNDQAQQRYRGFTETMRDMGCSVLDNHIIEIPTPTTAESGYKAMIELLDQTPRPDAVFFQAEIPAHGAIMACISRGINIPRDIGIVGFGDLDLSAMLPVPLTTVKIPSYEIGQKAAQLIVDRLSGKHLTETNIDVGYRFIVRDSA